MGYGSKESTKETRQKAKRLLPILQKTFRQGKEMTKTYKEVLEDMSLAPKGKGREAAKKLYKASYEDIEDTEEGLSIAQVQQRRRNRMNAHLKKTMAKYRAASKAGIHPSRVNQRRTSLTLKKR